MRGSFVSKWSHWKPCTEGRHNINWKKNVYVYPSPKRTEETYLFNTQIKTEFIVEFLHLL